MERKNLTKIIGDLMMMYRENNIKVERIAIPEWMLEVLDSEFIVNSFTPKWLEGGLPRDEYGKIVPPELLFGVPLSVVDDDFYIQTDILSDTSSVVERARLAGVMRDEKRKLPSWIKEAPSRD